MTVTVSIIDNIRHKTHTRLENGSGIDGERCTSLEARKRLDGVEIEGVYINHSEGNSALEKNFQVVDAEDAAVANFAAFA